MPHRDGHPQPQKLDLEATTIQVSFAPPPVCQLPPTVGKGFARNRPGQERLLMQAGGAGRAQAAPGGPLAHLQTACRPRRRTRDHAGEGQNRTEENSEEQPAGPVLQPGQEAWPGATQGSRRTDRTRTARELGHVWGRVHPGHHAGHSENCLPHPARPAVPWAPRHSPPPATPPTPGHSPSFTEMVGFFCRSPSRMKKRTRGMKISKAKTHWKGRAESGHLPGAHTTSPGLDRTDPSPPLPRPVSSWQAGPAPPSLDPTLPHTATTKGQPRPFRANRVCLPFLQGPFRWVRV